MTHTRKDFYLVAVIGFCVGWLVLMPAKNLGFEIKPLLILASVVGLTFFAPLALFILKFLGRFWPVFEQFGKFAAVGTLNTLLYLAVINLLIFLTDISRGVYYSLFVVAGFLISTTNSYLWNKFWTFQSRAPINIAEYGRFAFFTLIGILINAGTASLIVNVIGAPAGFNPKLWANVGALVAVAVTLFWNFTVYRYFVFRIANWNFLTYRYIIFRIANRVNLKPMWLNLKKNKEKIIVILIAVVLATLLLVQANKLDTSTASLPIVERNGTVFSGRGNLIIKTAFYILSVFIIGGALIYISKRNKEE